MRRLRKAARTSPVCRVMAVSKGIATGCCTGCGTVPRPLALAAGVDLKVAQDQLGHLTVGLTAVTRPGNRPHRRRAHRCAPVPRPLPLRRGRKGCSPAGPQPASSVMGPARSPGPAPRGLIWHAAEVRHPQAGVKELPACRRISMWRRGRGLRYPARAVAALAGSRRLPVGPSGRGNGAASSRGLGRGSAGWQPMMSRHVACGKGRFWVSGRSSGSVFARCGCRDRRGGRRGASCPRLGETGHGSWYFSIDLPRRVDRRNGGSGEEATGRVMRLRRNGSGCAFRYPVC
jgi:hypothetical protein